MAMDVFESRCRLQQAEAVLSLWLEHCGDVPEANLISSVITLLDGIDESLEEIENKSK